MSKRGDVAFGRRGGHAVADGFDPTVALAEIQRLRDEGRKAGTWPDHAYEFEPSTPIEGRQRMARARLAAGVPLNRHDEEALRGA